MTNTEKVRDYVLKQFLTQPDVSFRNMGIEHTLQVVSYSLILSKKQDISSDLIVIAAYFHDLATYLSHYASNHALRSSKLALETLPKITTLSDEDIDIIVTAIKNHSSKETIDDIYSEVLKNADVLSHYLSEEVLDTDEKERLENLI